MLIAGAWGVLTGSFAWCVQRLARSSIVLACIGAPFFLVVLVSRRAGVGAGGVQ